MRRHLCTCVSLIALLTASAPPAAALISSQAAPDSTAGGVRVQAEPLGVPAALPDTGLPSLADVHVLEVKRADTYRDKQHDKRVAAGIGDIIVVRVNALEQLMNYASCRTRTGRPVTGCQQREIALFLDGREIKGLAPESGAPQADRGTLRFHLDRDRESDEAWADLLGAPRPFDPRFFHRPTEVSVGLAGGFALPTKVVAEPWQSATFHLIRIRVGPFWAALAGFVLLLLSCWYLARKTDLLRDAGPSSADLNPGNAAVLKPYSIGRWQMAVWFILVIGAFLYIWTVTGAYDTVTPTALALIGIGAGTALGAAVIDAGKLSEHQSRLAALEIENAGVTAATNLAGGQGQAAFPNHTGVVKSQIAQLKSAMEPKKSDSWLTDILTDGAGTYSFHRFQMLVWTIVLVVLFLHSVWLRLSMPEFSGTLLALMGISGGTYLGFKIPEKLG